MPIHRDKIKRTNIIDVNINGSPLLKPNVFLSAITPMGILTVTPPNTKSDEDLQTIPKKHLSKFTNEAIEGLRCCHGEFVAMIASQLATGSLKRKKKRKSEEGKPVKKVILEKDVENCLVAMEWGDLLDRVKEHREEKKRRHSIGEVEGSTDKPKKKLIPKSSKTSKGKKVTEELISEQEQLLTGSWERLKGEVKMGKL